MNDSSIGLQRQGYQSTPLLWSSTELFGLHQLKIDHFKDTEMNRPINEKIRLGNRVERFVGFDLKHEKQIKLLAENIQIRDDKVTIGELDCLLLKDGQPIHLEIVFKFYLYDPNIGISHLEHWIGANRKDSLIEKLDKLKNHQLPLLYHPRTKSVLNQFNLDVNTIKQHVHFKAQLFVPLTEFSEEKTQALFMDSSLKIECLFGFYINLSELDAFQNHLFYLPNKTDWLINAHSDVKWMDYEVFKSSVTTILSQKRSPLCWLKSQNGAVRKFFVVWW